MRHAKAEKSELFADDFERPLTKRGFDDAALICKFLKQQKIIPKFIVASPSKRTIQTAEIVAKFFDKQVSKTEYDYEIYEASINDLVHAIRRIPEKYKTVMLIGHNPSITGIIGYLTGNFIEHVSTSGIAVLKFKTNNWQLTSQHCAELILLKNPKELYS